MQIPVIVEPISGGFRAQTGAPLNLVADGATSDEAVAKLRALYIERIARGARLQTLDVPTAAENPWLKIVGIFKEDDPDFIALREAIAENRRREDEAEGR